jgi:digeranylgeranylglycerophospholipid reductase
LRRILPGFRNCAAWESDKGAKTLKYDAVIVGASIAGLSMGIQLAKAGWNCCVVDRRHEIGLPVRCGEATGNRAELARYVEIDESWIAGDIAGLAAHAGKDFVHREPVLNAGVMLHRDRFEKSLAEKAAKLGVSVVLDTLVTGLFLTGENRNRRGGVTIENGKPIEAAYIIDASGVESLIGRSAGITKELSLDEIASSMQYRIKSTFCNDGFLHFFIGAATIPHGYIWVFPKTKDEILVGGGMYRVHRGHPNAKHFVDRFIEQNIPDAPPHRDTIISGGIPVTISPEKLVKENVLVVGDAARQVNPLTAGGIMNALEAADMASRYLLARGKNAAKTIPDSYSAGWRKNQRRQHKLFMLLREIWFSTPDEAIASRLQMVFSLAKKMPDRSMPFRIPVITAIRFLLYVLPLTFKNIRILFR